MKPISTPRTAFYAIFFAVILVTFPSISASTDELPSIDLPDFVISGVEQATLIRGDRLILNVLNPEITTPGLIISLRPSMASHSVNIVPSRPEVIVDPNRDFGYADLYAGNFYGAGVRFGLGTSWDRYIITGSGWYNYPPRLFNIGENVNGGGSIGINVKIPRDVILHFDSEFSRSSFYLPGGYDLDAGVDNDWQDFRLEGSSTPLTTEIGSFSGWYKFHHWLLNGEFSSGIDDLSANQNSFSLIHEIPAFNGRIETSVNGLFEPLDLDSKNLSLITGKVNFGWWKPKAALLRIGFGFNVYSGSSGGSDKVNGFQPNFKAIWSPTIGGLVFLKWNPNVFGHSLRSTMQQLPMLTDVSRGSIAVDKARVEFGYELRILNSTDIRFKTIYNNTENYPLLKPVQDISTGGIEYAELKSISFRVDAKYELSTLGEIDFFATYERTNVQSDFFSDGDTKMQPFIVGIIGNGYWQKWQLSTDLSWHDATTTVYDPTIKVAPHYSWDLGVGYNFRENARLSIVCLNLLNNDYEILGRHRVAPFTMMLKGSFGTNLSILDSLLF